MSENIFGEAADIQLQVNAQTAGYQKRQSTEVQAAVLMAKQFPRNEQAAFNRIVKACKRKTLAESAMYEYPRGGTKVTGPSIRLAEAIAQCWGNIDFGFVELEQRQGASSVMAFAWDLETNTRRQMVFDVPHSIKAKGKIKALEEPREIYEQIANQASRRVRSCVLGVIPGDVIDAAIEECKKTLQESYKEPVSDRIKKMVAVLETDFQVTIPMLEEYFGCNVDALSANDWVRLKSVYRSLRDGMTKREEIFNIHAGAKSDNGDLDKIAEEIKKAAKTKGAKQNQAQESGAEAPAQKDDAEKKTDSKEASEHEAGQVRLDG